jgi:hypothetical protein
VEEAELRVKRIILIETDDGRAYSGELFEMRELVMEILV